MANKGFKNRRGVIRCSRCRTWRARQAFVRSFAMRGSAEYLRNGFTWTRFKTCNNCACTRKDRLLSPEEFLEWYGAELHNDSEPDEDDEGEDGDNENDNDNDDNDDNDDNAGNGNGNGNGNGKSGNNGDNAGVAVAV